MNLARNSSNQHFLEKKSFLDLKTNLTRPASSPTRSQSSPEPTRPKPSRPRPASGTVTRCSTTARFAGDEVHLGRFLLLPYTCRDYQANPYGTVAATAVLMVTGSARAARVTVGQSLECGRG
jgi:hypothetical protein